MIYGQSSCSSLHPVADYGLTLYFCIETKGLSLEAVDELYSKVDKAWKSKGFVPTVNFQEVQQLDTGDQRRSTLADLEVAAVRRKSMVDTTEEYVHDSKA